MFSFLKININPERIYGLDILRASAILFVVLGHGYDLYPDVFSDIIPIFMLDGVSIFFVLSGFLIGRILIKLMTTQALSIKLLFHFWIRRWTRTLPNYFLVLILLIIINSFVSDNFKIWDIRSLFYFSQNLFSHDIYFFAEAWSISIEEWFYFLIPLAIFFFTLLFRLPAKKVILVISILTLLIITYLRLNRFYDSPAPISIDHWDLAYRKQVFMRLDTLMYGVIGAYVFTYFQSHWLKYKRVLFVIGLSVIIYQHYLTSYHVYDFGIYHCVFSFSVDAFGTLLLLPFLSSIKSGRGFVYKSITYISLISYSMYLINYCLIKEWIIVKIPWEELSGNELVLDLLKSTAFLGLTIIFSILLYKYFELPMMKIRDHKLVKRLIRNKTT
ncbi:MAG: peptidoglycan/LPS O-acetylase OafA/YrhL [Crocinitomicaceae bacterium]|jgi:peptidoglycan/LPS O-acetylase OafA/YrhL